MWQCHFIRILNSSVYVRLRVMLSAGASSDPCKINETWKRFCFSNQLDRIEVLMVINGQKLQKTNLDVRSALLLNIEVNIAPMNITCHYCRLLACTALHRI